MITLIRSLLIFSFCFIAQLINAQNITRECPPIIPYWAFGHWVWEDERNTHNAIETLVNGYKKHNIPVSAVIMDSPWMNSYNDFEPDTMRYPHLVNMIGDLHRKGIRVIGFYTGCLNSTTTDTRFAKCKNFDYVINNNYAINNNQESKWWKGKGVHYDPTNEKARAWWHTQVNALHNMNFDGAKIDFGFAWFGDTILTSKGRMPRRAFAYQYFGDAFDYHTALNEEFVAMTYAWSGRGLMGFPSKSHVNWVGDFQGDWKGLKDQLRNIYLSANYGFSGVGCEIGGYWKVPSNKEQFIRYTQLSSLCPVMINGGSLGAFAHHLPWNYDKETLSIYQKYVGLHYELSYYLFSTAVDAHLKQATILKNCSMEQESHFLGDQLFIKVITDSLPDTSIQLPDSGKWIDYWTDSVYRSGSLVTKAYSLNQYPIFIKPGTILPLNVSDSLWQQNESDRNKLTFLIYPDSISRYVFHKPVGSGIQYTDIFVSADKASGKISVDAKTSNHFIFLIKCQHPPKRIKNADQWKYDAEQRVLRIEKSGKRFEITLL